MALLFYQTASSRGYVRISIPRTKTVQTLIQKSRGHRATRCKVNNKVVKNLVSMCQQSIWTHDFMEDLETNFSDMVKVKKLEKKVVVMLTEYESGGSSTLQLLELVDDIQRLGLGYRFQTDIRRVLNKVASISDTEEDDLHAFALKFRLLREHGYRVSQDFLQKFKDSHGGLIGCLQTDFKALLSIYEASCIALERESDLHEDKLFATENLRKLCGANKVMDAHINHALDVPLYRRMQRLQARWYIDVYGKRKDVNQHLLELAILDFNIVQRASKRDLQQVLKWWTNTLQANNSSFNRNILTECFFWSVGMAFEPRYDSCRILLTKVCALITIFDDIYDTYESLDELKVLTNAVQRWNTNTVENISLRLQVGFFALHNTVNEMCLDTLARKRENIMPILARVWGELCEALFVEAKWTRTNYMPTLEEYLDNAWRSSFGVVILTHGYLSMNPGVVAYAIESLEKCHDLFKWSSMIFRLHNDLATSSEEIDRIKSASGISCYMYENGVSEEVAREYINTLIDKAWMKLIEARVSTFEDPMIDMAINLARVSHCVYQYRDGHRAPDAKAISSVIIKPITIM